MNTLDRYLKRVIFVEDDDDLRIALSKLFASFFDEVISCPNGKEAYDRFLEKDIDLIITDLNMPIMGGIELGAKVKALNPTIPIIAISAYNDEEHLMNAFRVGFDDYLIKPIVYNDLVNAVARVSNRYYLAKELELHKKIVSSTQDMLAYLDEDRRYRVVNLTYASFHGYNIEYLIGKTPRDILRSDVYEKFALDRLDRAYRGELVTYVDWFNINGEDRYMKLTYIPYWSIKEPKHVEGVVVNIHDMTEWKKAEDKLTLLNRSLVKTVASKVEELREKDNLMIQKGKFIAIGEMLSMIAHQWRQPINAISTATISLKLMSDMDSIDKKLLEKQTSFIQGICQTMSKTINDFMSFFSPSQKKSDFSLIECFQRVENMITPQLANRDITYQRVANDDIVLFGADAEIEHVLLNLISNARDAFEEGNKEEKLIRTSAFREGDSVIIEVADNAGGIKVEPVEKVFDPYFTTKPSGVGTGIGLYMSKTIIERHFSGKIWAFNRDDGAVFRIELPRE